MIKFFRKIRQQLLTENNFSKYLIYAVGEIILVVIGILIALSINNWNEKIKFKNKTQVMLSNLVQELDQNTARLRYMKEVSTHLWSMEETSKRFDSLLVMFQDGADINEIQILCESPLIRFNEFNLNTSVYDEMISAGTLSRLERKFVSKINMYYKLIERESKYNSSTLSEQKNAVQLIQYGYRQLKRDYQSLGISAIEKHSWIFDMDSKNYNDLITYLEDLKRCTTASYNRIQGLIEATEEFKVYTIELSKKKL
jgi:uncharacterized protein DUF6090